MQSEAKEAIETLELWLRNIIDNQLTEKYGEHYLTAKNLQNKNIIKSSIVKKIHSRLSAQEGRFSRKIDALLLDEEARIICNPSLYKESFKEVFELSFEAGNEMLRTFLKQLIFIRNKLFHSNHISEREYEKVICYSHDIVDAIKDYYKRKNMEKEYNAPSIIYFQDSLGNKVYSNQFNRAVPSTPFCDFNIIKDYTLYPTDVLTLEVNVDDSFLAEEYKVCWIYKDGPEIMSLKTVVGQKISIEIKEKHVQEKFRVECFVKSNKVWHRYGSRDDMLRIFYKILPLT